MSFGKVILTVIIFAMAFAYVEASVVVYLRHLLGVGFTPPSIERDEILFLTPGIAFLEPQTVVKIIKDTSLLNVERIREAFTLVMLAAVASLAGGKTLEKVAYFSLIFGIWDIFYYLFLRLTVGWPKSIFDLDIFFLLPTPWIGPVFVPIVASTMLVIGSVFILIRNKKIHEHR